MVKYSLNYLKYERQDTALHARVAHSEQVKKGTIITDTSQHKNCPVLSGERTTPNSFTT